MQEAQLHSLETSRGTQPAEGGPHVRAEGSAGSSRSGRFPGGLAGLPLWPGTALARFQPVRFLGQGGFGFVVLAVDKVTGEDVAIKFVECK